MTLNIIYNRVPDVIGQLIAKNVHELNLAEVLSELKSKRPSSLYIRGLKNRLQNCLQQKADAADMDIMQFMGGEIGQYVNIIHHTEMGEIEEGIGYSWKPYTRTDYLKEWKKNKYSHKSFHDITNEEWSKLYATSQHIMNENTIEVSIMIGSIPNSPDFAEFEELNDNIYMWEYPGFIPLTICIDSELVILQRIPLTKKQRYIRGHSDN